MTVRIRPLLVPHPFRNCPMCGVAHSPQHASRRYCEPACHKRMLSILSDVSMIVFKAIKAGLLPKAKGQICVDCGWEANCYDHRDYTKPLDVVPVCTGCNTKRGPASRII